MQLPEADSTGDWNGRFCLLSELLLLLPSSSAGGPIAVGEEEVAEEQVDGDLQLTSSAAEHGAYTITFTTNFRRAVNPPQVILIRGRVVRVDGSKIHVRGTVEDKDGEF